MLEAFWAAIKIAQTCRASYVISYTVKRKVEPLAVTP